MEGLDSKEVALSGVHLAPVNKRTQHYVDSVCSVIVHSQEYPVEEFNQVVLDRYVLSVSILGGIKLLLHI